MMYRGQNARTKGDAGWFGSAGRGKAGAFTSAPVRLSDNRRESWLVAAHDTYAIDRDATRVHHVLHLHGDETFGGGVATVDKRLLVLTNRRLVVLDDAFVPRAQVALPIPFDDLAAVDAARVGDGLLVSFMGGQRQRDGVVASPQVVELLGDDGVVREVGRRELQHTLPTLFEHVDWWVSPAMSALVALPDRLIDDGGVHGPDGGALPLLGPRPAVVWCAAGAGLLLALAGGLWWTRAWAGAARLDTRVRAAWCLACLVFGLPALLSLMVLRPRPRMVRSAAVADRATWERALP